MDADWLVEKARETSGNFGAYFTLGGNRSKSVGRNDESPNRMVEKDFSPGPRWCLHTVSASSWFSELGKKIPVARES